MNVFEAIKKRRSVRAYKDTPVPKEKILKIIEAARLAPSAGNRQPWRFIVVTRKDLRERLMEASFGQKFVGEAPVVIAAIGLRPEHKMECDVPSYAVDLAIAVDHMTLVACEEGLGTCWIGAFRQDEVRKILRVPSKYKVVALLTLGYPADKPSPKVRKPLEEIVCWEEFEE